MMKASTTITFRDAESSEEAVAIVRRDRGNLGLCLSLKSNGEIEVVMKNADARKLLDALKNALIHD